MRTIAFLAATALAFAPTLAGADVPGAAKPTIVTIRAMHFTPDRLTIVAGTTVIWVNEDDAPHTVTARNKAFRSAALDTKDRFAFTFAAPGEFAYYCTIHPFMTGRIIVKPAGPSS